MNRRQTLADARTALAVRQVQERAALLRLQLQRQAEDATRTVLEERQRIQDESEAAWRGSLEHGLFDPITDGLWRDQARQATEAARQASATLDEQADTSRLSLDTWRESHQRTEAAERVAQDAVRRVGRQVDNIRLMLAEDARHAVRPRR